MDLQKARQHRLSAARDALSRGYGGISAVAKETGMSRTTITKGIAELREEERLANSRVHRSGSEKNKKSQAQSKLLSSLDLLIEPTAKSKSRSPLRWTTKSTRCLSEMLKAEGFRVSHTTVCRRLNELGYNISTNRKSPKDEACSTRNKQFEFISAQSAKFLRQNHPVISVDVNVEVNVDAKKKLKNNHKRNLRVDASYVEPEISTLYECDKEENFCTPAGYDYLRQDFENIDASIDDNTAMFAVLSIHRWWRHLGNKLFPETKELYVIVTSGGDNGSRSHLWKWYLQKLVEKTGLTIHVSHFPPGTSKWNKIKHQLYNYNSIEGWTFAGVEVIINVIGRTTDKARQTIHQITDANIYQAMKISDANIAEINAYINIVKNGTLGEWNYTIAPK